MTPSLLDLFGIKIQPEFLFGRSLLDENQTIPWYPNNQILNLLYHIGNETQSFTKMMPNCSTCNKSYFDISGIKNIGLNDYLSNIHGLDERCHSPIFD